MVSQNGTESGEGTDEASLGQGPQFQEWSSSLRWLKSQIFHLELLVLIIGVSCCCREKLL